MLLRSLAAIGLVEVDGLPKEELIARVAGLPGETFSTAYGTYKRVRMDGGAEVWIDIAAEGSARPGQLIGATPFHDGAGAIKVEVQGVVVLDQTNPLVGGWQVLMPALALGDRRLPLTLEIVPFRLQTTPAPTFSAYVRMVGLASEATVYPSPAAFLDRAPMAKLVSVGGVSPLHEAGPGAEGKNAENRCSALVTGRIEESYQLACPLTGQPYFRLVVMTDRGRFNILAGGRTLLGAAPLRGAVVQAKCRLVATPADAEAISAERNDKTPADTIHPAKQPSALGAVAGDGAVDIWAANNRAASEWGAPAPRKDMAATVLPPRQPSGSQPGMAPLPRPAAMAQTAQPLDAALQGAPAEAATAPSGQGQPRRPVVVVREARRGSRGSL